MKSYTYLFLHLITIFFPLTRSFEGKINYYRKWKFLFPGMILTAAFFLGWDVWFAQMHVWSFNPEYLLGIYMFGLPLEEWMFFFTVPFSCIFIYEALNYYIREDYFQGYAEKINILLILLFVLLGVLNFTRIYTVLSMFTAAIALACHMVFFGSSLSGRFYLAYGVHLIPFFLINGILTSLPVVLYNDVENLGVRIGTIPIEDMAYSMTLLLMNISFFEYFKSAALKKKSYGHQ